MESDAHDHNSPNNSIFQTDSYAEQELEKQKCKEESFLFISLLRASCQTVLRL